MKKKLKKIMIILVVVLLIVIAFWAYRMYSTKILVEVANNVDKFQNETGDFSYRITTNYYKTPSTSTVDFIKKDNIYVKVIEENDKKFVEWRDMNFNSPYYNYYKYELDSKENIEYSYYLINRECTWVTTDVKYNMAIKTGIEVIYWDSYNYNDENDTIAFIKKAISTPLKAFLYTGEYDGEECYIYKDVKGFKTYISKETMLPIATKMYEKDGSLHMSTYIEYNTDGINEEILKEPDINTFDNANYRDSYFDDYIWSGRDLEDEYTSIVLEDNLIENIDLKENEELDFFNLKENNCGLKQIKINKYETYEKFREKYSNLRELTEKDFEYYYVTILYKNGYKLEHTDTIESTESLMTNYVFSEEKSNTDNIVVIISPNYEEYQFNVVLSNEKIDISSEKAFEIYRENIDEIKEKNNIDKDVSIGSNNDKIVKLDNKTYKKLNYIKTELKDTDEPICWEIKDDILDVNNESGKITTYINAITGDLIGTIYTK